MLSLQSQYIYLLLLFVVNNGQHFKINSDIHNINTRNINTDIHNINTRNNFDLHYPQSHLSVYQKGSHYTGIKAFNRLPLAISNCPMTQNNLKWL
jgi:hypothetical protein